MKVRKCNFGTSNIFPQADVLYKVLDLAEMAMNGRNEIHDIFSQIDIATERQITYYKSAAQFIGILNIYGMPTDIGYLMLSQSNEIKLELLVYLVLSSDVFYDYYKNRSKGSAISKLKAQYGLSSATAERRFLTVESWISTCDIIISDFKIQIDLED